MLAARRSRRSVALQTNGAGRSSGPQLGGDGESGAGPCRPSLGRSRRRRAQQLEGRHRAALATFSDSTPPCMGMASTRRARRAPAADSPSVSLPSTSATRPGSAASSSDAPAASSPYTAKPPPRSAAQPSAAVPPAAPGARNATPAEALTTSGSIAGTPRRGSSTPSSPAAVALRSIMPTLAGLVTPVQHQHRGRAAGASVQELLDRGHPRCDDVGEHALVVPAVAGEHLHPVRAGPLHRHAPLAGGGEDRAHRLAAQALGQHDLVHSQRGVVERLQHRLAAVHGDEGVLRRSRPPHDPGRSI